jgi:hypothetical protein
MVIYGTITNDVKFILDEETANIIQTFAVEHKMDICTAVIHLYNEGVINLFNGNEQPDADWNVEIKEVEGEIK